MARFTVRSPEDLDDLRQHADDEGIRFREPDDWMLDALGRNPEYPAWGPGEEYMPRAAAAPGDDWRDSLSYPRWSLLEEEGGFGPDRFNEVVNFYFEVETHSDTVSMALVLWVLHPRLGVARAVRVDRVSEHDMPAVYAFLAKAAERNAARFAKVVEAATAPARVAMLLPPVRACDQCGYRTYSDDVDECPECRACMEVEDHE